MTRRYLIAAGDMTQAFAWVTETANGAERTSKNGSRRRHGLRVATVPRAAGRGGVARFGILGPQVEPYRITLFGVKTLTFTRGLSIDGLVSLVLGNALLLMSTHKTLTPDVLLGYFVLIQCTLVQQFKILLVTTPGSKLYMLEEDGPTTPSAWRFSRTLPSAIQIYFSSQLGWVVFGLAMRKLPPLF